MGRWIDRLGRGIHYFARAGRNLLLPPRCLCCDGELADPHAVWPFCVACLARLGPETWRGCQRCGGQVGESGHASPDCLLCKNAHLKFDAAVPLGSYHAGLRRVVLRMKRPYHHALSLAMARLLFERRRERLLEQQADIVVPIPMHWSRRIGRGINNPDIVGQCLAKSLGIPLRRDILIRRVNTTPQADLPPSRRFENVRGVFGVRRLEAVAGARILLVDDVLTTGATCSEAAKVLKRAGASAVAVTVIARAQGK